MKRFTTLLNRSKSNDSTTAHNLSNAPIDSPQANAVGAIQRFCESGSNSNGGEEVLHLPVIVEAAESSPSAAAASAQQIRRFLTREWSAKPYVQYNAIMLVRILSDNPGPTFTRNFDKAFVVTVKELLRGSKDHNTQQILRETLDSLEVNKAYDEGLQGLFQMWRKEKGQMASLNNSRSFNRQSRAPPVAPPQQQQQQQQQQPMNGASWQQQEPPQQQYQPVYTNGSQQYGGSRGQGQSRHQLPPPFELASRVEEARNTAKILMQLIQSTPPEEVMHNELIKEFNERCQSAQKSMHAYISCDSPPPDDDTLQTLIETNEQLSLASSRYQRAILAARRAMGASPAPQESMRNGNGGYMNAPLPPVPPQSENLFAPAPQHVQNQYAKGGGQSLFAQPQQSQYPQQPQMNGFDSYVPPSGPISSNFHPQQPSYQPQTLSPPANFANLSRPPSSGPVTVSWSDPFVDPVEHDPNPAPLAIEPTNYGPSYPSQRTPHSQPQPRPRQASTAYSLDGISNYSGTADRRNTLELENSYATTTHHPSPPLDRRSPSIPSTVTPVSALSPNLPTGGSANSLTNSPERTFARPGPGPWHSKRITESYVGRQASAAEGLTMHGAGVMGEGGEGGGVAEIDSHSDVGRRDRDRAREGGRSGTGEGSPRVDIRGTGGFRSSVIARS
ncbi:hypothetical protein B0A55_10698 [Friedmanniomyces simplex]|uniref:GAT domain-containing protein n=1 Tax=Friedmanniomyces simplex TaxID=329884 RepID=A0A4V6WKT9_9PEZI|nr:hypothetical protein B0A55_10698 [Friedmanniomyces simplex]